MEGKIGNQKISLLDGQMEINRHPPLQVANEPNISEHTALEPIMKMPVISLGVSLYLLTLWQILAGHGRWLAHALY